LRWRDRWDRYRRKRAARAGPDDRGGDAHHADARDERDVAGERDPVLVARAIGEAHAHRCRLGDTEPDLKGEGGDVERDAVRREAVPLRKGLKNRHVRHESDQALDVPLAADDLLLDLAESSARNDVHRQGGWRKSTDRPLGDAIAFKHEKREHRFDRKQRARPDHSQARRQPDPRCRGTNSSITAFSSIAGGSSPWLSRKLLNASRSNLSPSASSAWMRRRRMRV